MALTRIGPNQSINLASNVTGTLPTGNGGTGATSFAPGKVLQVVTATSTTNTSINATSFTDTGLSASITPSSTSSKIFVATSQGVYGYINSNAPRKFYTQLVRGSTAIAEKQVEIESGIGSRNINVHALDGGFTCLDSPSSTSAQTFKTQAKLDSAADSSVIVFSSNSAIATITLMEIAG